MMHVARTSALCTLLFAAAAATSPTLAGHVGVNFGLIGRNPMPWTDALRLMQGRGVTILKTFSIDSAWLDAVRSVYGSGRVRVMVAIPNGDLHRAANDSNYCHWVANQLERHSDIVNGIAIGNEPYSKWNRRTAMPYLLKATRAIRKVIEQRGLNVQVTVPFCCVLVDTYPVSRSRFNPQVVGTIRQLLPLMHSFTFNAYPYFAYANDGHISLDFALGRNGSLLETMIRTARVALQKLGSRLPLTVGETGWPTAGGKSTNRANARVYTKNAVNVTRSSGLVDVLHLFEGFDELGKPGPAVEEHWGLYTRTGEKKFSCDIASDPA